MAAAPAARFHRGRISTIAVAVALTLGAAGCAGSATTQNNGTGEIVTGEQVYNTCYQNYFGNGILPAAAAKTNCTACIVGELHKLGINRPAGETEADVLTGERLSNSVIQKLQATCTESDASEQ